MISGSGGAVRQETALLSKDECVRKMCSLFTAVSAPLGGESSRDSIPNKAFPPQRRAAQLAASRMKKGMQVRPVAKATW